MLCVTMIVYMLSVKLLYYMKILDELNELNDVTKIQPTRLRSSYLWWHHGFVSVDLLTRDLLVAVNSLLN